jgi:excisionase family DNA binding protein
MSGAASPRPVAAPIAAPLLTVEETADLLRVHPSTVRRLVRGGQLEVRHIGRAVRIPRTSLDRLVAMGA